MPRAPRANHRNRSAMVNALSKLPMFLLTAALLSAIPSFAQKQQSAKKAGTHEACLKGLPADWGPNFGWQWRKNEALYWACRLAVPVGRVHAWQRSADLSGVIKDIIPVRLHGADLVLIESLEGSAHCYNVKALQRTSTGWQFKWSLSNSVTESDPMAYCTLTCPAIRMQIHNRSLELEIPGPANPKEDTRHSCTQVSWTKQVYIWNGRTFARTRMR